MKAILQPIHPEHCAKILRGLKTTELRTKIPKIETPYKVYVYCTKHGLFMVQSKTNAACFKNMIDKYGGKVIGEYICGYILSHCESSNADIAEQRGCIRREKIFEYSKGKQVYGMGISDLVIYDKPKELSEFYYPPDRVCGRKSCANCNQNSFPFKKLGMTCYFRRKLTRPPQSWCYVEELLV